MDPTHRANIAYSTACSLRQLAKTIPYVDGDRRERLIQHARNMVAPFRFTLSSTGSQHELDEAITKLMEHVHPSIPRHV
jgi:hypothetical protein